MVTKGLKLKIPASETLYSGQVTLSTQLVETNYLLSSIVSRLFSFPFFFRLFYFLVSVFNLWRPLTFQCWFSVVEDTPLRMLHGAGRFSYWPSVIWTALIVWWSAVQSCVERPKPCKVTALFDWKNTMSHREPNIKHTTSPRRGKTWGTMLWLFCALDLNGWKVGASIYFWPITESSEVPNYLQPSIKNFFMRHTRLTSEICGAQICYKVPVV